MHDFNCKNPDEMRDDLMRERAKSLKKSEEGVREVSSVMEEIRAEAEEYGREQGRQEGMEQGRQEGMEQGMRQGRQEGMEQGMRQGRQEGMEQGMRKGMRQGRKEGMQKGLRETALRMLSANRFTQEEVSAYSGFSLDEVKKLAK